MRRRDVVTALGVAVASSLAAKAHSTQKVWQLGWLEEGASNIGGNRREFFSALQELGYTEGQNLAVEYRFANTSFERLPELAAELVGLKLDVIVALSTQALLALQQATSTVPIVMVLPGDPLGVGLVKTLAHPGANVTGTSLMMPDIGGKRLQLLKEIVPTMRRVTIIGNSKNKSAAVDMRATEAAAKLMGVEVHMVDADSAEHLENGLDEIVKERPGGVVVILDSLTATHREKIAKVALQNRIASIGPGREYAKSGALAAYGPNLDAISRRAAVYVDKILKGAKPADLPVEQPTQFELVINIKTAKALEITIPYTLLVSADEVID